MGLLNCCGLCGGGRNEDSYLQPLNIFQPRSVASLEELQERSAKARQEMWETLGTLEPLLLTQPSSPVSLGGPKWPSQRQAFRVVRKSDGNVIIASDGLSDPFDDITLGEGNVNGFGLEFFIETPEEEVEDLLHDIKRSWQFQLLYTVSQLAAGHGGIRAIMDDMSLLSTEAEGVNEAIPEAHRPTHVNEAGRVGALLGLKATELDHGAPVVPEKLEDMPLTDVLLVNIKLLSLPELKLITDRGAEGRRKLGDLFMGPDRLVSSLHRTSVI